MNVLISDPTPKTGEDILNAYNQGYAQSIIDHPPGVSGTKLLVYNNIIDKVITVSWYDSFIEGANPVVSYNLTAGQSYYKPFSDLPASYLQVKITANVDAVYRIVKVFNLNGGGYAGYNSPSHIGGVDALIINKSQLAATDLIYIFNPTF